MTREEHIENLKTIASDMPSDKCADWIESLMAGVKALEQEPCGDVISRQAVLDGLASIAKTKAKSDAQKSLMGRVMFFVKKLQSVTPMQKWIPCSERLPEDNTLVLVTVKVGNREPKVRSGYYYMNGHFHIDNGDCWEARDKELIAWMQLPTPYQSEIPTEAEGSEK